MDLLDVLALDDRVQGSTSDRVTGLVRTRYPRCSISTREADTPACVRAETLTSSFPRKPIMRPALRRAGAALWGRPAYSCADRRAAGEQAPAGAGLRDGHSVVVGSGGAEPHIPKLGCATEPMGVKSELTPSARARVYCCAWARGPHATATPVSETSFTI